MTVFLKCHSQQSMYFQGDNKMKAIILITAIFLSQLSLAGTGGGGVMMRTMSAKQPEIVYNIGKQDGVVKFAYGQLVDQKWQIQNIEMKEADLTNDVSTTKALESSSNLKDWAEIK